MSSAMDERLYNHRNLTSKSQNRNAGYEELPESIKAQFTETEWLWQSDKRNFVLQQTEPETE